MNTTGHDLLSGLTDTPSRARSAGIGEPGALGRSDWPRHGRLAAPLRARDTRTDGCRTGPQCDDSRGGRWWGPHPRSAPRSDPPRAVVTTTTQGREALTRALPGHIAVVRRLLLELCRARTPPRSAASSAGFAVTCAPNRPVPLPPASAYQRGARQQTEHREPDLPPFHAHDPVSRRERPAGLRRRPEAAPPPRGRLGRTSRRPRPSAACIQRLHGW